MSKDRYLWEILVPATTNAGKKISVGHHRIWDAKIRAISGGLTLMPVAKGQWQHEGFLFKERTIPVRVLATRREIETILDIMLEHYSDQIAVLAYKISEEAILKYREGKLKGDSNSFIHAKM